MFNDATFANAIQMFDNAKFAIQEMVKCPLEHLPFVTLNFAYMHNFKPARKRIFPLGRAECMGKDANF